MICAAISRAAIPAMPPKTPSAIASGLIALWALVSMSAGVEDDPPTPDATSGLRRAALFSTRAPLRAPPASCRPLPE